MCKEEAALSNRAVNHYGQQLVAKRLEEVGAVVAKGKDGGQSVLRVTGADGRETTIVVKVRRSGTWQIKCEKGFLVSAHEPETQYWVFVDLSKEARVFYIAPDWWVRNDIYNAHQGYLARHQGTRPETPDSSHHAIDEARIGQWKDCWSLLPCMPAVT